MLGKDNFAGLAHFEHSVLEMDQGLVLELISPGFNLGVNLLVSCLLGKWLLTIQYCEDLMRSIQNAQQFLFVYFQIVFRQIQVENF